MAYEGDTRWAETLHSRLERSICDEGSAVRVVDGVVGTEGAEGEFTWSEAYNVAFILGQFIRAEQV
jgi:hypothetical protein